MNQIINQNNQCNEKLKEMLTNLSAEVEKAQNNDPVDIIFHIFNKYYFI